ncbi:MAG: DNA gyrase C-terminal beta-propeller domain-containing protein, partial [Pseudomonadota bacterium]
ANTHTPVLFFSNFGKVYKLKVYRLPIGSNQAKGKALVNIFPLAPGETITNFMPLPEDESTWDNMHIMFATSSGNVRRNDLSDFHDIRSNGKIAMKLDEGDKLIGVMTCSDNDNVLLAAKSGKCVRFPIDAVRVFKSRTSDGVRGMRLGEGDSVISMSILKGAACTIEERAAYLKMSNARRRLIGEEEIVENITAGVEEEENGDVQAINLSEERFAELAAGEQFILTITENGFGKRSSAYEYRLTNRGGSGIVNIITSARNGAVIASFPVEENQQIMLMTDKAKLIRTPVEQIRIAGRSTQGVTILKTAEAEKVVSATAVKEDESDTVDIEIEGEITGGEE